MSEQPKLDLEARIARLRTLGASAETALPVSLAWIGDDVKALIARVQEGEGGGLTDAHVKHMADRFLGWRLPETFNPDCGIHFDADAAKKLDPRNLRYEPMGTNLLDATQATAMVRHMLKDLPALERNLVGAAEAQVGRYIYRRIERLMDAKPGSAESAELDFLANITVHVEEYGEEACADHSFQHPSPSTPKAGDEGAVAWRVRGDGRWATYGDKASADDHAKLLIGPVEVQPLYASPIREPEISRTALIETMRQHIKADAVGLAPAVIAHYLVGFEEAADAILNLAPVAKGASQDAELSDEFDRPGRLSDATRHSAEGAADPALSGTRGVVTPVGGRGEEGSARADLSPASRSPDQHSAGWRCRRCGRDEIDCQENGCPRGPCPMEFVG